MGKRLGRDAATRADPNRSEIFYTITSCSAITPGGERRKSLFKATGVSEFCLHSTVL